MYFVPLSTQEAVLSSRIEGTQATLGEVLRHEAEGSAKQSLEKIDEIREVLNYRMALCHASKRIDKLPICGRLIKEAHAILMKKVRGKNKTPGQFKSLPNAIGHIGCTAETAKFLPITPDHLNDGMTAWEKYTHSNQPDILVQLSVMHAEFEALHPFSDGNGRLGRMLIPLFLYERKVLRHPSFYLSEYFETHRDEYYERLLAVSREDDWTGWCRFFLKGIKSQARKNTRKAKAILNLYDKRKSWILELVPASGRRSAIFAYRELLNITEGRDVF